MPEEQKKSEPQKSEPQKTQPPPAPVSQLVTNSKPTSPVNHSTTRGGNSGGRPTPPPNQEITKGVSK